MHRLIGKTLFALAALGLAGCARQTVVTQIRPVVFTGTAVLQRAAVSDTRQLLLFLIAVNPDCTIAEGEHAAVTSPPSHGRVDFAPLNDFPYFAPPNPRFKCNDRRLPGEGLYYTSDPGFHGVDQFVLDDISPNGQHMVVTFRVTVR
jgi:hypothetical protein